ncbi:MAG: cupin domain-containing protein [Candidatus Daviesbacteria bacterium]|nr:cupin domain-containing protein [Candidatus Daviesbacteria bacterium]
MAINVTHVKPEFIDDRGYITRLVNDDGKKFVAVLYITSKAGTQRANHYHKKDAHYVYCLSGKFRYSEKNMKKSNSKVESVILKPGDLVLTKPMIAHAMEFMEDTVFLAITTEHRQQGKYEDDLVRIKITTDDKQ